jgi:hypothetical protein
MGRKGDKGKTARERNEEGKSGGEEEENSKLKTFYHRGHRGTQRNVKNSREGKFDGRYAAVFLGF